MNKITKREALFSIAIISIMLLLGIVIHQNINDSLMLQYQEYNTALQINDDQKLFEYGMRTSIGNAFVYGELKALNPVSYPEIDGEYTQVEKIKEQYTMHTRTVTYTVDGETRTKTEIYWTWDAVDSWFIHSDQIAFLDIPFEYGTIEFPSMSYIDTVKVSSRVRYVYYGTPVSCIGTLYAVLNNSTIENASFYNGLNIQQTIECLESGSELIVFWTFWICLSAVLIFGFYYLENNWLEDRHTNHKRIRRRNAMPKHSFKKSELRFSSTYLH